MADAPPATDLHDCRDAWAQTLCDLAAADPRIVAVVNDAVGSSRLSAFLKRFPDRLINVGIAEQTMVGVAAGLASAGRIPFVSAASCFLTARPLEQIKADVAYGGFNVKLVGQSSAVAYGERSPTHHSIEDFAWLRPLTPLTLIAPANPWQTKAALRWAAALDGPVYLRLSRMPVPSLTLPDRTLHPGQAEWLTRGADVTISACGTMVHLAIAAATRLATTGIFARVLNMATLNPLDDAALLAAAADTGAIVTVTGASVRGGLGGAVLAGRWPN